MVNEKFLELVDETIEEIRNTLITKGNEYSQNTDRLRNFKDAAELLETIPEYALFGFVTKHIIALKDFLLQLSLGGKISEDQWKEKTGDIIAYMILLRALLRERGVF